MCASRGSDVNEKVPLRGDRSRLNLKSPTTFRGVFGELGIEGCKGGRDPLDERAECPIGTTDHTRVVSEV